MVRWLDRWNESSYRLARLRPSDGYRVIAPAVFVIEQSFLSECERGP